jgi:hypothetical protein
MIRTTDRARERVDAYLAQVRRTLSAHPDVDADEVVADVRSHIDEAIAGLEDPVGEDEVQRILDRLGAPLRWTPAEEIGGWRGILTRIRGGPDDWRLAYLCFGLTVVGLVTAPFGGLLLLFPAFVLARGALALAAERGEGLPAQRWLLYPALVLVYLAILLLLFSVPIAASMPVFATGGLIEFLQRTYDIAHPPPGAALHWVRSVGWTLVATGAWWSMIGGAAAARPTWVRALFRPFADRFRRSRAWGPILAGAVVSLAGILVLALS